MPHRLSLAPTPLGDVESFKPSAQRPVRVRARTTITDAHFEPHAHAWAQLAYCATGLVQVTAAQGDRASGDTTYIVPPSRAVWIAPGARHSITVLEAARFRTLYLDASVTPPGWQGCRVIQVSALMREAIEALDALASQASQASHATPAADTTQNAQEPQGGSIPPSAREQLLGALVLDELTTADTLALGVALPHPQSGDKRLRALCAAILRAPAKRATLAQWAADVGASERTMARLFRDELKLSYQQWRQQAILAHALPLLARGQPVSQVAAASGYASDSAFSAMFKAAMGQSPSYFQSKNGV